jgi:hypothetical protein
VRKFMTRHQLVALLFGQLGGATSLRTIEATMEATISASRRYGRSAAAFLKHADRDPDGILPPIDPPETDWRT